MRRTLALCGILASLAVLGCCRPPRRTPRHAPAPPAGDDVLPAGRAHRHRAAAAASRAATDAPTDVGPEGLAEAPPPRPRRKGLVLESTLGVLGFAGQFRHVAPPAYWLHAQLGYEVSRLADALRRGRARVHRHRRVAGRLAHEGVPLLGLRRRRARDVPRDAALRLLRAGRDRRPWWPTCRTTRSRCSAFATPSRSASRSGCASASSGTRSTDTSRSRRRSARVTRRASRRWHRHERHAHHVGCGAGPALHVLTSPRGRVAWLP